MSVNNITFILHKPQLSENIGACARGMKNFNFKKMIIVNPKPTFPNDKILATSVGAKDIIKKCKNFIDLQPALKNIDILIATSARFRNKNVKHIQLEDLKKIDFRKKIAFLFGSEASGLSNKDLALSNYILQIPTSKKFKSLNLSHSVTIVCYEVFNFLNKGTRAQKAKKIKISSKFKVSKLVKHLINLLQKKNFFVPEEKKQAMLLNIHNLIYRLEPNDKELRILASIISALNKKND